MSNPTKPMSKSELRQFGLVTAAMLVLFFELLIPWIWDIALPLWPLFAAGILILMGLLVPAALGPVYHVWMRFANVLGWINTRIILSLVFFVIFFPFGMVMRLFNDPMRRKPDPAIDTYRITSTPPKPENMERPF